MKRNLLLTLVAFCTLALAAPAEAHHAKVSMVGSKWYIDGQVTYPGAPAEGLLMNVRMVNAVFEDDRPQSQWANSPLMTGTYGGTQRLPQDFDPDKNTDAFIAKLPDYVAHGMLGFTINLQGGAPGYEGAHNSAFNSNGTLRPAYMERVKRVIQAADNHGAVIILGLFYQRQHGRSPTNLPRALANRAAILAAAENTAKWVRDNGFTNVVIEIANEYPHNGFSNWNDGDWFRSHAGQVELMNRVRSAHPGLLVSTSGMGDGRVNATVANAADFIIIHTNHTAFGDYPSRIQSARSYGKPVIINEDDKFGSSGAQAAQRSVENGAGWGLMHYEKNQRAPFMFGGAADDRTVYNKVKELTEKFPPSPAPNQG